MREWFLTFISVVLIVVLLCVKSPIDNSLHKDYQLQITNDSIYVYRDNILIGTTEWGINGVDSIILYDNDFKK